MANRKKNTNITLRYIITTIALTTTSLLFHHEKIYGYANYSPPQIDMLSLLDNKIYQLQQEDQNITLSSPLNFKTIVVPEDTHNPFLLNIYIPVWANADEPTTDTITLVGCLNNSTCPDENSTYSNTILIPGIESLNIAPYLPSLQNPTTIYIRGLINASFDANTITYERITPPSETIQINLQKIPPNIDNDKNGLPENLSDIIDAQQIWYSNQLKNGALRTVILLPLTLNSETNTIKIKLTENTQLELPNFQALLDENLLTSQSSVPFVIISLTNNFQALIDITSDNTTTQDWLNNITQTAPGILLTNSPIISIFLLQKNDSHNILPINLENSKLTIKYYLSDNFNEETFPIGVFTYPAKIFGQYFTNDDNKPNLWRKIPHTTNGETLETSLTGNCILSTFQLLLKINSVSPSRIAVNTQTPLTLNGLIPVTSPKTVEEANSLYEVRIAGQKAEFRNGTPTQQDIAITPYIDGVENQMFITSPPITTPGKFDIEIIDKSVEGYSYLLPQAIQVLNIYTLNTNISRLLPDISPNAKITLTPTHSPELNQPNKFFDGDNVILTISDLDPDSYFVGWYDTTGALLSTQTSVLIKVQNNTTITAKITKNQNYTVTVNVDPPNSGTISINPQMEDYPAGTTITLQATPAQGYLFDKWLISDNITNTQNPLTLIVDQDYNITAIFKEIPVQLERILPFEHAEFVSDDQGKQRLAVWIFGGVACEIKGTNLNTKMNLKLINSTTGETLIDNLSPISCSSDGSTALLVVPKYPNYSDDIPQYIDTDLKYENSTIPSFRYYHYRTDTNGITYTAFLTNLNSSQKISIHLESTQKNGELELPAIGDSAQSDVAGIIRTMILSPNPTASASASLFGNTLINSGIYGSPIAGIYEVSLHLYQPKKDIKNFTPGQPTYEIAKNSNGIPLLIKDKYPYNTDGTPNSQITPIKIKLPANDLDYNFIRDGLSVFGQLVFFDYISNQLNPQKVTGFQSQLLANDIDPPLTETSQGPAQYLTLRAYYLNSFGIRMGSLLPFQTTSLIRLTTENGVLVSPLKGKVETTIISPQGGLAYIDRIVIKNPQTGYQLSVSPIDKQAINESKITFKTPQSQQTGIMDILLYTRGNPTLPIATLPNTLLYYQEPKSLDYLWQIPAGIALIILGATGEGPDGGGPCFIATAAYGTPLANEINVLRAIRDQYLLTNTIGTAFVEFYYNVSPPIADFISHHPLIASLVRIILIPLITIGRILLLSPFLIKTSCATLLTYLIFKKIFKKHPPLIN